MQKLLVLIIFLLGFSLIHAQEETPEPDNHSQWLIHDVLAYGGQYLSSDEWEITYASSYKRMHSTVAWNNINEDINEAVTCYFGDVTYLIKATLPKSTLLGGFMYLKIYETATTLRFYFVKDGENGYRNIRMAYTEMVEGGTVYPELFFPENSTCSDNATEEAR